MIWLTLQYKGAEEWLKNTKYLTPRTELRDPYLGFVYELSPKNLEGSDANEIRTVKQLKVEDIKEDDIVIGELSIPTAIEVYNRGGLYYALKMEVPPEMQFKDLSAEQMKECGAKLKRYDVVLRSGLSTHCHGCFSKYELCTAEHDEEHYLREDPYDLIHHAEYMLGDKECDEDDDSEGDLDTRRKNLCRIEYGIE